MKKSVACGVVTFNPTKDILPKIEEYSCLFDYVYIYDNTIKVFSSVLANKISKYENVSLYSNGNNDGLAKAYNYFLNHTKHKYDFLCTLDQDSKFSKIDIQNMFSLLSIDKLNDVAVVGPTVIYNQVSSSKKISNRKILENKRYLISSGSFINLKIIRQNPNIKFDENYFIDRVDTDFCTNCLKNGYRICEYKDSFLF
ncbi:glycosyltransferase, partial [Lactobacillus helveticus]